MSQADDNAKGFIARNIVRIMTHAAAALAGMAFAFALAT